MKYFACPHCGHKLEMPKKATISHGICIKCRERINVQEVLTLPNVGSGIPGIADDLPPVTKEDLDDFLRNNFRWLSSKLLEEFGRSMSPSDAYQFIYQFIERVAQGEIRIDSSHDATNLDDRLISMHIINAIASDQIDNLITEEMKDENPKRNAS